jgi:DNA-binding transcriptional MerR regulator
MKTLSISEVARQAGVNPARLGQWLATGKLQRPKMSVTGGRIVWLWTEADIERIRQYKAKRHAPSSVNHRPGVGDDQTV